MTIKTNRKIDFRMKIIVKQVDESLDTDTTLQNDDELLLAVEANKMYGGYLVIAHRSPSATPDLDFTLIAPAGSDGGFECADDAATQSEFGAENLQPSGTNERQVLVHFWIQVGATAGNLQLQWAQNVSNASAIIIKAGSHMVMFETI